MAFDPGGRGMAGDPQGSEPGGAVPRPGRRGGEARPRERSLTSRGRLLDFYARPGPMTGAGRHAARLAPLPAELPALVRVVQGLLRHELFAEAYGLAPSAEPGAEAQLRSAAAMLDRLLARDRRPLAAARAPGERLAGVCRHFAVLLAALLRAQGVPARARCGFATYFVPGRLEDHWVCEVWRRGERRWALVDAQLDERLHPRLAPDLDPLDVPRDAFLVAAEAWTRCREAGADPARFGFGALRGLAFVAGNLVRDLAALNRVEMLPWDVWGAMPPIDAPVPEALLPLLDRIAAATRAPDRHAIELRRLYEGDARLRVPASVFNARMQRVETV